MGSLLISFGVAVDSLTLLFEISECCQPWREMRCCRTYLWREASDAVDRASSMTNLRVLLPSKC